MTRKHIWLAVIGLALVLLLSGCMESSSPVPNETAKTPSATVSATSSETPAVTKTPHPMPSCPNSGWNVKRDVSDASPVTVAGELFDVRVGKHTCFDKAVFDIASTDGVDFRAEYVDVVGYEGTGKPVNVAGDATIQLVIYAMTPRTLTADQLFKRLGWKGDFPSVREVRFAGSFEGESRFAIGVAAKRPFAVEREIDGDVTHVCLYLAH